jgi:hypothetical protein
MIRSLAQRRLAVSSKATMLQCTNALESPTNCWVCRAGRALSWENLNPLPGCIGFEDAAALPFAGGTALYVLSRRGHLGAGETLAVLGAAGGTGLSGRSENAGSASEWQDCSNRLTAGIHVSHVNGETR